MAFPGKCTSVTERDKDTWGWEEKHPKADRQTHRQPQWHDNQRQTDKQIHLSTNFLNVMICLWRKAKNLDKLLGLKQKEQAEVSKQISCHSHLHIKCFYNTNLHTLCIMPSAQCCSVILSVLSFSMLYSKPIWFIIHLSNSTKFEIKWLDQHNFI